MPNLAKLVREGTSGYLESTLNPCFLPAWASFATGKMPGKHGAFGFTAPGPDGRRHWANSTTVKARRLWHILGDHGWTVGVVNVPPTFPPEEVNGYLVSDASGPPDDRRVSYPAEFHVRLAQEIGTYPIHLFDNSHDINGYLDRVMSATKSRRDALCYMMENLNIDFFLMSFEAPERIAYGLWKYLDKREELYSDPAAAPIREKAIKCFELIDDALGHAMELVGEDGHVIVFSAHGFGPLRGFFLADHFLSDLGFLKLKHLGLVATRLGKRLGLAMTQVQPNVECHHLAGDHDDMVRWKDSLAFTGHHYDRAIHLLRQSDEVTLSGKRREYQKALRIIQEKLLELRDNHGRRAVAKALTPEEAYDGPCAGEAPDLTVIMADPSVRMKRGIFMREQSYFQEVTKPWGTQVKTGILAAWGKSIQARHKLSGASVTDLAPTILHLTGLPVPEDMDGQVLTEMLATSLVSSGDAGHAL